MKKLIPLLILLLFFSISCKKDTVDSTNLKTFQNSINDMTSSLNTLEQVKFNEALYILKTFGVEGDGDTYELTALSKLIAGKKVPEILAMADRVAQQNDVAWTSTGPPSLGEMNVFGDDSATEKDPNDISADGLDLITRQTMNDSVLGPRALQIIPRLVDRNDKPIAFEGAALETIMEVFSGGKKISTSKNLMQDNKFPGFTIRFANLNSQALTNNEIDVTVNVKTTKKNYKMSKIGIPVNKMALRQPQVTPVPTTPSATPETPDPNLPPVEPITPIEGTGTAGDPKVTVTKFLNNLSTQNLRAAYETADNPSWGSYETFSNPTSGFGSVKSLSVKNLTTAGATANSANVNATYDVIDKNGNKTALKVTFGLKNVDGQWKISSYRIN